MSKKTKVWLVIATSLVVMGSAIFIGTMASIKWDFMKLNTVDYETNTYEISETFKDISIETDTANIIFLPSEDENCKVICYEEEQVKHSVVVKDEELEINVVDTRKWYEYIGIFGVSSPKITVYLPQTTYDCLHIESSTGEITIKNISTGVLDLTVSTGRTNLQNITCKDVTSEGDTGDITMKNVVAEETFSIKRSTGDVKLEACDAAEIFIETDTGDVVGSLLTGKEFFAESDTGNIDVPKMNAEGKCKISTDTGDIKIMVAKDWLEE